MKVIMKNHQEKKNSPGIFNFLSYPAKIRIQLQAEFEDFIKV